LNLLTGSQRRAYLPQRTPIALEGNVVDRKLELEGVSLRKRGNWPQAGAVVSTRVR